MISQALNKHFLCARCDVKRQRFKEERGSDTVCKKLAVILPSFLPLSLLPHLPLPPSSSQTLRHSSRHKGYDREQDGKVPLLAEPTGIQTIKSETVMIVKIIFISRSDKHFEEGVTW